MDALEQATPIVAYPILSEEAGNSTMGTLSTARTAFFKQIGMEKQEASVSVAEEAEIKKTLELAIGSELIDIQEILKGR